MFIKFSFVFGLVLFCLISIPFGQNGALSGSEIYTGGAILRQDTIRELWKRNKLTAQQPDTNFTYEKYSAFLTKVSDTSRYIVLPLNEFRKTYDTGKIIIGLRHDVDVDLNLAYQFSETETKHGFRSTYFILHTAPYYLANKDNKAVHSEGIIPILRTMQDEKHFEIGWHNDLVTLQAVYNIDPVSFLHNELAWLRANGINIYGTASHGSNFCNTYKYLNFYFFEECTYPAVGQFVNNLSLSIRGQTVPIKKGKLSDFNLDYEAYFLDNNKYFSDASITDGKRWDIGMLDLSQLQAGDRVIILLHPTHWHKASTEANINSFTIAGQISSSIDTVKCTISVLLPNGVNKSSLLSGFSLSPGACAKVSGQLQLSGKTINNFNNPLTFTVYAENRDVKKDWIITAGYVKSTECDFKSFIIPDITKTVTVNNERKTVFVKVNEGVDLTNLSVHFELSPGAGAWINNIEQFSDVGLTDFSKPVQYKVIAEDGFSSCIWTVAVQKKHSVELTEPAPENLLIYPNPSKGNIHLQFRDINVYPLKMDIYNIYGVKVYSEVINNGGNYTIEADLTTLPAGIYFVKYSDSKKPGVIIIQEH